MPDRALWRSPAGRLALGLLTFALVCLAWVFFRADGFGRATAIAAAMLGLGGEPTLGVPLRMFRITVVTMAALLVVHWALRDTSLEAAVARCPWFLRSVVIALMLCAIATMPGEDRAFIYFQF